MPITAWQCPSCNDPAAPLSHFEENAVCAGVVDPAFAAAVLASDRERHGPIGYSLSNPLSKPQVHVTDGLGCPRKTAILWQEQVAVDPLKYTAVFRGSAVHATMQLHAPNIYRAEFPVNGELAGVRVVGRIDRLDKAQSMIIDFKTPNDFSMRERKQHGAKNEDMAQVSMYAELVQQSMGWTPRAGRIWYIFGSAHVPGNFAVWPIEQALELKPYGSSWNVSELLQDTSHLLGSAGLWKKAPLYGESFTFGNASACDYCPVKGVCWTQAKGAPV